MKKKTVGIRIPQNPIALAIVRELGHPLVTTSANVSGETTLTDPAMINDLMGKTVDMVIDGGVLLGDPSTVIGLIDDQVEILRQGSGETTWITQA